MDAEAISQLVKVVELKDESTAAHTWRVALYTQALAEAMNRPQPEIERAMKAAVLHDIGKIDIPYRILAKPGRLTGDEYDVIKTHAVLGYDRLIRLGETDEVILSLVRSHHERIDGSGYPDGLAGDDIPLSARVFSVIDSFDAMTSRRPYRNDVGLDAGKRAIAELKDHAGRWYWPEAVELFVQLYESGSLEWILHYLNDEESLIDLPAAPQPIELDQTRMRFVQDGKLHVPKHYGRSADSDRPTE